MAIDIIQEGFTGVTFDVVGKQETSGSTSGIVGSAVYPSKDGFNGYQCSVWIDSTGSYVKVGNVTKGSINITNNIETDAFVLGSQYRADAAFGKRQCSGDFTMFFEDLLYYNLFLNGTEVGIKFLFDDGTHSITFEFPAVKLGGSSPQISNAAGINLDLNFKAKRSTSDDTDVICTFVNDAPTIPLAPGESY
jgi:hypothetical protein